MQTLRTLVLLLLATVLALTSPRVCAEQSTSPGKAAETIDPKSQNSADSYMTTRYYVHKWVRLPTLSGLDFKGKELSQSPLKGVVEVVVFVASWCIQCQELSAYVTDLQKKYSKLNTRFTYIFSHDLAEDALGFAKKYNISSGLIASHDILKAYHNPELPSVYLSDRHGWLLARFPKTTPKEIKEIDSMLGVLTSY